MKTSQLLLATLRETPADAELVSHQLMLRAGMIRKLASGLYTWLPLGLKVLHQVERIVHEEMQKAGAQEILMPAIQPKELWQETNRWDEFGPQLLKMHDRHQREFCYGPTHEEVITDLVRKELKSYKQVPMCFYQIQTKFRDEIRPRFGVMRAREFLMKDAYSFHIDNACLEKMYQVMYDTYSNIFKRLHLNFRAVLADTGSIGGSQSHEFHVLADSGEDAIAFCAQSGYAANVELATALPPHTKPKAPTETLTIVETPGITSVPQQAKYMDLGPHQIIKTLLVEGDKVPVVALLVRGDHELNEIKAAKHPHVKSPLTLIDKKDVEKVSGCQPGFVGPKGLNIPIIADPFVIAMSDFSCGANQDDKHYKGANWGRDIPMPENILDIRKVQAGDTSPDGKGPLEICRGIEVGHIFHLGDKYTQAMGATVLDENGKAKALQMGCYGIGISRIVAAAIEQNHDDNGIIWNEAMAPFQIALVPLNYHKSYRVKETADLLYQELTAKGFTVLLDDRNERAGVMFADIDLIGIPHRLVVGERGIDSGTVEYKNRKSGEEQNIDLTKINQFFIDCLSKKHR